jgi:hypothetical protein
MAGMSRDAPLSAFTGPWCATQSVARPTDVHARVQRCSRPRHGHLRYEVAVAAPVCVTVVIGVRGGPARRLTRGGGGERMVVRCRFEAVKTGSSAMKSPARKKTAASFYSLVYSSGGGGFRFPAPSCSSSPSSLPS